MTFNIIQYLDFGHCVQFKKAKYSRKCSDMVLSLTLVQVWPKYLSIVAPFCFSCQSTVLFAVFLNTQLWTKFIMTECMYNVTLGGFA
jgi:hypothetical protein